MTMSGHEQDINSHNIHAFVKQIDNCRQSMCKLWMVWWYWWWFCNVFSLDSGVKLALSSKFGMIKKKEMVTEREAYYK